MKGSLLKLLGALAVCSALHLQLPTACAQGTGFRLLTTFTNPEPPTQGRQFGYSVAALGSDRVVIGAIYAGASDAGAAYLFSTNGTLLTTFTNPTPAASDFLGYSVAAVGTDRVLIGALRDTTGARDAGAVYLFGANGVLMTTFTNPTPTTSDLFGGSMTAVGDSQVLIGAASSGFVGNKPGAAFLLSTNGALLKTFAAPEPEAGDHFGCSVTAVGSDRVLIGAFGGSITTSGAGAAYLFSTDGKLLTTFTKPTPAGGDYFGHSVATVGADRVLIGAVLDSTSGHAAGAAYLFNTNGTLLTIFTNPTPAVGDEFGWCVAAVGSDKVLIGAWGESTSEFQAGAAYLFSNDGALLTTFTNPTPAMDENFGRCIAAVENDRVLIGASGDNAAAWRAGAVYLFSLEPIASDSPSLTIRHTPTNTVAVSWPSAPTGWTLQENTTGVASVNWSNAPGPIQDDGGTKILIVTPSAENRFYRLIKP